MKLLKRHIKTFESFIQNPKEPKGPKETTPQDEINDTESSKVKHPEPKPSEAEPSKDAQDEKDPLEEFKEFFKKQELNRKLWKYTI